jgi:predicted kinase
VIARLKGYIMLRTDMIRLEVLRGEDIFDEKVAANMDKRKMVYEEMFRLAHELCAKGDSIILDATFIAQSLRRRAAEVAARHRGACDPANPVPGKFPSEGYPRDPKRTMSPMR